MMCTALTLYLPKLFNLKKEEAVGFLAPPIPPCSPQHIVRALAMQGPNLQKL